MTTTLPVTTHTAHVTWTGGKEDLRAHTIELAGETIDCSSAAEFGGNGAKADPEELFVASLSACHMLWFLDFCRRERLRLLSYEDRPEGTMDGTRFTRVVLRPQVGFEGDVPEDVVQDLHHRAHEACFIANSVNCPVEVESR
jgi:organic hydroperoxide reductase OsmC/OhrA